VVVDRYWASTRAYADVEGGTACLDGLAAHIHPADFTLYLEAPIALRAARLTARGASTADRDSLLRARELEAAYARALQEPTAGTVIRLDASLPLARLVTMATRAITRLASTVAATRPVALRSARRAVCA
jgi:thymidylate kinase